MDRKTFLSPAGASVLCATADRAVGRPCAGAAGPARTQAVVAAAQAFLDTLDAGQRSRVQFPFPTERSADAATFKGGKDGGMTFVGERFGRSIWSNFPTEDVPRSGLRLGDLDDARRDAAMGLLRVLLSPRGYRKVFAIMGSDDALAEGGTPFAAGRDTYTLGLFGTPSIAEPWLIQFGGHHLGLNAIVAGERAGMMPILTGAQPAVYEACGVRVRALDGENDKAFALLGALDAGQRARTILGDRATDLMAGPGRDGRAIPPEGLPASAMTGRQRAMLLDLIGEWAGILHDAYARPRLAEIEAGLDETAFSWRGPTTHEPGRNGAASFRIQGPRLVIEFAPQRVGGDPTQHVHTVYRDPEGDYGRSLTP